MNKSLNFLLFILSLVLISSGAFFGCSNSSDYVGEPPEIDPDHYIITFHVQDEGDVEFTHKDHADYYDNTCMVCHMHTDVRDDTIWSCSDCHDNEDSAGLCVDDSWNHDCMFAQCDSCHKELSPDPDPTPACTDCHIWSGPPPLPPSALSYTVYGSIYSSTQVDQHSLTLTTTSDVRFDVGSFEGYELWSWGHYTILDLELPNVNNNNGADNDKLKSNIFLLGPASTVVAFKDGTDLCACSSCHYSQIDTPGYPGCGPSGITGYYGLHNPTLIVTGLPPGDYVLAIGAQPLTGQEAWDGINNSPNNGWSSSNYNNYKIIFSITPN